MPRKPSSTAVIRKMTKTLRNAKSAIISQQATITELTQRAEAAESAAVIQHNEIMRQDVEHETALDRVLKEMQTIRKMLQEALASRGSST